MASYLKREISEWNTSDLSNWLIDNKYPGISELCQNNSLSGYDLFYITDDILKNELGLNSFHERKVTMKLIKKLIYEHLKLNIINSNGDNVVLTLDNNPNTSLGELSEYIGNMFNINPKDILYKDTTKTEVLSPSIKIVELLILYPRLYKTLNVFNMKDYYQTNDNENNFEINDNMESKENTYNMNLNNNSIREGRNSANDSEYQKSNIIDNNKNRNVKMNFNYKNELNDDNVKEKMDKYDMRDINLNNKRIIYNEERNMENNKDIIYNDKYYNKNMNENSQNENTDENYNEQKIEMNKKMKFKRANYDDNDEYVKPNQFEENKAYSTYRPRKNMNFNFLGVKTYQDNYSKPYKNYEKNDNYYDN